MITLSMIVKNEEKYIKECLESVKGIVDEIVVVDTGSTDDTIKIAKSFGAKIYSYKWINDFAAARNFALVKSTGDWILYLDADERLLSKSKNELKKLTRLKSDEAYYCRINNIDNVNNRPSVMAYVRLFPNDKNLKFEGAIHEQIESSLKQNKYKIKNSLIEIDHIGYSLTSEELKLKAKRNLQVLLEEYKKKKSPYISFHLGQTYGLLENKEKALRYFYQALEGHELKKEYKALAYRYIGISLAEKQNFAAAEDYLKNSIECDPDQPLNLLAASEVYLATGKFKDACTCCYQAYKINKQYSEGKKFSFQSILLDDKSIIYQGLKVAISTGNSELFNFFFPLLKSCKSLSEGNSLNELQMYDELLNNKDFNSDKIKQYLNFIDDKNLELVVTLLERYNKADNKALLLNALCNKFPSNAILHNKFGITLMQLKDFANAEKILEKANNLNENYPSTIFYLVSVYMQNNNLAKVAALIQSAEIKYASSPEILNRLTVIKKKLNFNK